MKTSLALFFLLGAATAFAAERPVVSVTIDLPYAKILPGVPFDIVVTYKNVSERVVGAGATASLIITPLNGVPVRLPSRAHVDRLDLVQSHNFELQPGETQTGTISWHSNWFYEDAALTGPGTYDVALELTGDAEDAQGEGLVYAGTVRTAPARLVRIEPTGDDGAVWNELREAAGGAWPSHGFGARAGKDAAERVLAQHPRSAYYPYALLLDHVAQVIPLDRAKQAAAAFGASPAYPHLLVAAAASATVEARKGEAARAPAADVERYLRFALELDEAAVRTRNPAVRAQADINQRIVHEQLERVRHATPEHP